MNRLVATLLLVCFCASCAPLLQARPGALSGLATSDAVAQARAEVALSAAEWSGDEGVVSLEQGRAHAERAAGLAQNDRQVARAEMLLAGVEVRSLATHFVEHDHDHPEHSHEGDARQSRVVDLGEGTERAARTVTVDAPERTLRVERIEPPRELEAAPSEVWEIPVRNPRVTSRFGPRIDPITGARGRMHRGVDFGHPTGTPCYATASGRVLLAGWCGGGPGNCVVIEHDNGWRSQYFHLSRATVAAGTTVDQGDAIGEIGSTGRSTGPHLHFQLGPRGEAYDPEPLFGTPVQ